MARKLKTYRTILGFFELAVAAPSMKAALEAWGMTNNAFQQGFASETDDARIIAATMARPGVVLKRPVGIRSEFTENPRLPENLPAHTRQALPAQTRHKAKKRERAAPTPDKQTARAAIISFEREKAKRDRERDQEESEAHARVERRQKAIIKAKDELDAALEQHEQALLGIASEQEKLARRADLENEGWAAKRKKLEAALERAGKG
jgi:colicin import membrane protein